MSPGSLRVSAPAKVNLHLAVGPLGADGYHPVETVMHTLRLADEVLLSPAPRLDLSCDADLGLRPESNLAYRAARAMGERFGRVPEVAITLSKRIPAGAGLGGASADAAAVIMGLASMWGVGDSALELSEVARGLGADVPFFLTGGAARLTGRGDVLAHRLPALEAPVVVVRPMEPVSTAAAYRAFDALTPASAQEPDRLEDALRSGDANGAARVLYNAMTPSSTQLVPAIGEVLALLRTASGVLGAEMSGSGSAVYGLFGDAADAERCAEAARARGFWASATALGHDGCVVRPA